MTALDDDLVGPLRSSGLTCQRYRVDQVIGRGAVATVYRATDEALARPVALKVLDPLQAPDDVGRRRFLREFEVLCRIDHPGVARALRLEQDGDLDILVLELIEGDTLASTLERGRLDVALALSIAGQLAGALAACHAGGILHRDLKPANIILHPERGPVILDFGLAWFGAAASLTRTGAVLGSPQYMAPEVFSSSLLDPRADIYSLGAILFEMLTGRAVHLADGMAELALAHLRVAPPSVSVLRPELDQAVDRLVARAIACRPEERFSTASELARALHGEAQQAGSALASAACPGCKLPLIVDLPFCGGCGRQRTLGLTRGPYAVTAVHVKDAARCADWLAQSYAHALGVPRDQLLHRLGSIPLRLVVGVAAPVAERLAAEAGDAGCRCEVVHMSARSPGRIQSGSATLPEILGAALGHIILVCVVAALLRWRDVGVAWLASIPALATLPGLLLCRIYIRRPLLRAGSEPSRSPEEAGTRKIRLLLGSLVSPRARHLALAAVARAGRLFVPGVTIQSEVRGQAFAALERALLAAHDLDQHASLLQDRSRSRLATVLAQARFGVAQGEPGALEDLMRLEAEAAELTDASLAHDLAARCALEATEAISSALS